jgi:PPK2 family polyphosphate:nucleotide phosphotransferase
MKINIDRFRVREGEPVHLNKWPTSVKPVFKSRKHYKSMLEDHVEKLTALQRLHYATGKYSILLIFQALDAAGKDGAIRHVMSGVNPQGCEVFCFKQPSTTDLLHDFLWRTSCDLPERGRIGIFNRSYYEEVLVTRVHPTLLPSEGLPDALLADSSIWRDRYRSIKDYERHLHANATVILKFYLHMSKDEQRKRFIDRIDEPEKNWKFSLSDVKERGFWDKYMLAFEECLTATSTDAVPWYVVPADDKDNARLIVSQIVVDAMEQLDLSYPKTTPERKQELALIRKELMA